MDNAQEQEKTQDEIKYLQFDEHRIMGDAFMQIDPNTGWCWVGFNTRKFLEKDAIAYLMAQEFPIRQEYTKQHFEQMKKAQAANKLMVPDGKPQGSFMKRLMQR